VRFSGQTLGEAVAEPTTKDVNQDTGGPPDRSGPLEVQGRKSRFAASEITFGPVGRIVATLVVVGVVWWLNTALGIFGIVFAAAYMREFLPAALKDIWRPVRRRPTEQDAIRARFEQMRLAEQPPTPPASPIAERDVPTRW